MAFMSPSAYTREMPSPYSPYGPYPSGPGSFSGPLAPPGAFLDKLLASDFRKVAPDGRGQGKGKGEKEGRLVSGLKESLKWGGRGAAIPGPWGMALGGLAGGIYGSFIKDRTKK